MTVEIDNIAVNLLLIRVREGMDTTRSTRPYAWSEVVNSHNRVVLVHTSN